MADYVRMAPGWELVVENAAFPQLEELSALTQQRIGENAPIDTGALRSASYSEARESAIYVGVHSEVPNPNGGVVGDYAQHVINGGYTIDGHVPGNNYLDLSFDEALQIFRTRRIQNAGEHLL